MGAMKQQIQKGSVFEGKTLVFDSEKVYVGCTFRNCHLVLRSYTEGQFVDCLIEGGVLSGIGFVGLAHAEIAAGRPMDGDPIFINQRGRKSLS